MVLFSYFTQAFNCICKHKILILDAKKNTLKATETVKFFSSTFCHEPRFTSHQFYEPTLLKKKIFEGVWDGNFERSKQVKFAKFLRLVPIMVALPGSLNSRNQWINDRPLYQILLRPLKILIILYVSSFQLYLQLDSVTKCSNTLLLLQAILSQSRIFIWLRT